MGIAAQRDRGLAFADLHRGPSIFVMPNAWDAGSAKMLAGQGFGCLGTTSAGIAFSEGLPDHQQIDRALMLERAERIAGAVTVPVSVDLEAGYGSDPETVAETVLLAVRAGFVGANIEDFAGGLLDRGLAMARIVAAREAADSTGIPFTITARTDAWLDGGGAAMGEAIERSNGFRACGADCSFVPGPTSLADIASLVGEIEGPLSVVMGLSGSPLSVADLASVGVRRVSIGGSLARAVLGLIRSAAQEMAGPGTFDFAERQIPQDELNSLFGAMVEGMTGIEPA